QRLGDGAHLSEHVDAVGVLIHHTRDAAHLALDAAQPPAVVVLRPGVTVHSHANSIPRWGIPVSSTATLTRISRGQRISWYWARNHGPPGSGGLADPESLPPLADRPAVHPTMLLDLAHAAR